jgi:hypothetical protein
MDTKPLGSVVEAPEERVSVPVPLAAPEAMFTEPEGAVDDTPVPMVI